MPAPRESLLCSYSYDPLDLLISQASKGAPVTRRFYCKSRLASEIQGALEYSIVQHANLLLAQRQGHGDSADTVLLATDLQRSVLTTANANHQRHAIAYTPYGHHRIESGLTSVLGFNGERPDGVTGHYLLGNGYRAFNPILMRFNCPDNLSPFGPGGFNAYAYCHADPINRQDPNGHIPTKLLSKMFNALTNSVDRPGKTYINGPERAFDKITTVNIKSGSTWEERTYFNNAGIPSKTTFGDDTGVSVFENGKPDRHYNPRPTLQELAYGMIPGHQLDKLPKNFSSSKINYRTAHLNFNNHLYQAEHSHYRDLKLRTLPSKPNGAQLEEEFLKARDQIVSKAARGELTGVLPDYVKDFRRAP